MAATWAGKVPVTLVNSTSFTASAKVDENNPIIVNTEPENSIQAISVKITMANGLALPVKKGTIVRVVIQVTEE